MWAQQHKPKIELFKTKTQKNENECRKLNKNKLRTEMKQNGKSRRQNKPIGGKGKWKYMGELKEEGKQHTQWQRAPESVRRKRENVSETVRVCMGRGRWRVLQLSINFMFSN